MGFPLTNVNVKYWCPKCETSIAHLYLWADYGTLSMHFIVNKRCAVCRTKLQVESIEAERKKYIGV